MDIEQEQTPAEQTERQAERLQMALSAPLPSIPTPPAPSSIPSEMEALRDLLAVIVQRVEQQARANGEQAARVEQVLSQMVETMHLAQVMIAQQDELQVKLTEQIEAVELAAAALVKINANLSEIVAALLSDNHQKA